MIQSQNSLTQDASAMANARMEEASPHLVVLQHIVCANVSSKQGQSQDCRTASRPQIWKPGRVKQAEIATAHGFHIPISLMQDGTLTLINGSEVHHIAIPYNIVSFTCAPSSKYVSTPSNPATVTIVAVTDKCDVVGYGVHRDQSQPAQLEFCITNSQLLQAIQEYGLKDWRAVDVQLLQCVAGMVNLQIYGCMVQVVVNHGRDSLITCFRTSQTDSPLRAKSSAEVISCREDGSYNISFWNVSSRLHLGTIDCQPILQSLKNDQLCEKICDFSLALTSKTLIVALEDHTFVLVDVSQYLSQYPTCSDSPGYPQAEDKVLLNQQEQSKSEPTLWNDVVWKSRISNLKTSRNGGQDRQVHQLPVLQRETAKKKIWRVCGFHSMPDQSSITPSRPAEGTFACSKRTGGSIAPRTGQLIEVSLPLDTSLRCRKVACSGGVVFSWFEDSVSSEQYLCAFSLDKCRPQTIKLPAHSVLVLPSGEDVLPPVVLTDDTLFAVAVNVREEQIVNKLMLYENAGAADTLCRLNQWDRCSIPMHALEIGLKHRQLDTVAFFLKSRENMFREERAELEAESLHCNLAYSATDTEQLNTTTKLLLTTIQANLASTKTSHFSRQLLGMTLAHLHIIVRNVVGRLQRAQVSGLSTPDFESASDQLLTTLTDYVEELRGLLKAESFTTPRVNQPDSSAPLSVKSGSVLPGTPSSIILTDCQKDLVEIWQSLTQKAVIVEAILNGEIPLAQTYLIRKYGADATDLSHFISTGLEEALALLADRDIQSAKKMFHNMGFDPPTKLRQICLYTPDKSLRDYLITELLQLQQLTPDEVEMVRFVHQVEQYYSCPSFDLAKLLRTEGVHSDWEEVSCLRNALENKQVDLTAHCGDLITTDTVNSETTSYSHTILEWVRNWSSTTQHQVLLEWAIARKDSSIGSQLPAHLAWRHLCARQSIAQLLTWVQTQFPGGADSPAHHQPVWPYNQPIEAAWLDDLRTCTNYTSELLLTELARRGVLRPSDRSNLSQLVTRLSRLGKVIQRPHLVDDVVDTRLVDLHYHMIKYCIDTNLPQLLYFYLDYWSLCLTSSETVEVALGQEELPAWVTMMLCFRKAAELLLDPELVFEASLSASQVLQGAASCSVASMIEAGLVGRALATLMYSPNALQQQVTGEDTGLMQDALAVFPGLRKALFPSSSGPTQQHDITVYQLLQGDAPFDPVRLFGWHASNHLAGEDACTVLPHFGLEALVTRCGHQEELQFTYYLRQGRPCFAFCAVLLQLWQAGARTVPWKSMQAASARAYTLALRHFHSPSLPASCVAFTEMLGVDSASLRLHLQTASAIFAHRASCAPAGSLDGKKLMEQRLEKDIGELLLRCVQRKRRAVQQAMRLLQQATRWDLNKHRITSASFEAGQKWTVVHMFAMHYGLNPSLEFLKDSASQDDWMMWLTHAQMYHYTPEQLRESVPFFTSPQLREHLSCILNNISTEKGRPQQVKGQPKKDIRAQLYVKIGLRPAQESGATETSEEEEAGFSEPEGDQGRQQTEDGWQQDGAQEGGDLLALLLDCDGAPVPWRAVCALSLRLRNPHLAVLAACYQDHDALVCLSTWLMTSVDTKLAVHLKDIVIDAAAGVLPGSLSTLSSIVKNLLKHGYAKSILTALQIYQPESLLIPFLQFCCGVNESEGNCVQHLNVFKKTYHKIRKSGGDGDLIPVQWVENMVAHIISASLHTHTPYAVGLFLRFLDETNVTRFFTCPVLDTSLLYKLHQVTKNTGVKLQYQLLGDRDNPGFGAAADAVLEELQSKQCYKEARLFAEIIGCGGDCVTVNQLLREQRELKASKAWARDDTRSQFWSHCQELITKYRVQPQAAADFFEKVGAECSDPGDRVTLYSSAHHWLQRCPTAAQQHCTQVFIKVWKAKIAHSLAQQKQKVDTGSGAVPGGVGQGRRLDKSQLLLVNLPSDTNPQQRELVELSTEEQRTLDYLIDHLVDTGHINEALKVGCSFGHQSTDLRVILTCLGLASGQLQPDKMDGDMRRVVATPRLLGRRQSSTSLVAFQRTGSVVSVSSLSAQQDSLDEVCDPLLPLLQSLCNSCTQAKNCANFILTVYRISLMLQQDWQWVLKQDDFVLLHRLLSRDSPQGNRYALAKSYITTSGLQDMQVAGFLCDAILEALQVNIGTAQQVSSSRGVDRPILLRCSTVEPSHSRAVASSGIQELIQLCQDPAVLGQRLLEAVNSITATNIDPSQKMLAVEVELLTYSHDCFTLACHMEGISAVLRAAHVVTSVLDQAEEYNLMIRLLTGLGRFSEMTYVFELLQQRHQFELLFRKGMDKEARLRLAILDYLKRYHPTDTTMFAMLSHYFTMYREMAQMLQDAAHKELSTLKGKPLENTTETQTTLKNALNCFSDAAESYVKENCLRHAQTCVKKARQVALQIQLLSSKVKVLDLEEQELQKLVTNHTKFHEVLIVCEGHGVHSYWADALFQQVIIQGHFKYLQDFKCQRQLTTALIADVADKYMSVSQPSKQMISNMRRLLSECQDVKLTFTLARKLGFNELVGELLKGDAGAYLKDIAPA